jgi:repressor LexA
MDTIDVIKKLMKEHNMNNADLARIIFDIPKNEPVPAKYRVRISDYFKGKANIPLEILKKIANYFNVNILYLLGEEIPVTHYLPIIGEASCGVPTNHFYENSEFEMYPVPEHLYKEGRYYVKAVGDSMLPKIKEGDIVLCDREAYIDNGNIVHYTINGSESGIKKVIMDENGKPVMLMPLNDKYPPIAIKEGDEVRMAKCLEVTSKL